jgi:hypothetical protein
MHVAVIDIGKPGKSLGWAMVGPATAEGSDLDECIEEVARALEQGPVALGFEAPMFVPFRNAPEDLTKARTGECVGGVNRPFSASAGSTVLVTSTVVVPYVLERLRSTRPGTDATLDAQSFCEEPGGLLLFEAFVTNQKSTSETRHMDDARLAASHLHTFLKDGDLPTNAVDESTCFNILGAMMLRTDWRQDTSILSQPCLVVRP